MTLPVVRILWLAAAVGIACFGMMQDGITAFQTPLNYRHRQPIVTTAPSSTQSYHRPTTVLRVQSENTTETVESSTTSFSSSSSSDPLPKLLALSEEVYIECQFQDYADGTKPDAAWNLAARNFLRQGSSILEQLKEKVGLKEHDGCRPPDCLGLVLSNEAVKEAERRRIEQGGAVDAHPVSQALYDLGCLLLDELFDERPIQRFWFLEVIARIPYFSYTSMLHLYESFGWFRAVELRKVHAAEDWNELHHLLIMESLGGNAQWSDRFLGYHAAFAYYWFLIVVYLFSPRIAYQFMELLEAHAVDTYTTFVQANKKRLQQLPPPNVARSYYKTGDLYLFDDFQTSRPPGSRRPPCENLLDVFQNIAIDEGEHVKTMQACQDYARFGVQVVSPHLRFDSEGHDAPVVASSSTKKVTAAAVDMEADMAKRELWRQWSEEINRDRDECARLP